MASTAACESIEDSLKLSGKKSFAGIPEATFVVSNPLPVTVFSFISASALLLRAGDRKMWMLT